MTRLKHDPLIFRLAISYFKGNGKAENAEIDWHNRDKEAIARLAPGRKRAWVNSVFLTTTGNCGVDAPSEVFGFLCWKPFGGLQLDNETLQFSARIFELAIMSLSLNPSSVLKDEDNSPPTPKPKTPSTRAPNLAILPPSPRATSSAALSSSLSRTLVLAISCSEAAALASASVDVSASASGSAAEVEAVEVFEVDDVVEVEVEEEEEATENAEVPNTSLTNARPPTARSRSTAAPTSTRSQSHPPCQYPRTIAREARQSSPASSSVCSSFRSSSLRRSSVRVAASSSSPLGPCLNLQHSFPPPEHMRSFLSTSSKRDAEVGKVKDRAGEDTMGDAARGTGLHALLRCSRSACCLHPCPNTLLFLVTKLIRLCPTHRPSILMEFQGHVLRLLLHREASSVLADAFELYTNAYERTLLVRDFYGNETALFMVTSGTDNDKEHAHKGLAGMLEGADPDRRKRVLASMKEALAFTRTRGLTTKDHARKKWLNFPGLNLDLNKGHAHGRKGGAKCGVDIQTLYKLRSRPGRTGAAEDRPGTNELQNVYGKNVEGPTTPFLLQKDLRNEGGQLERGAAEAEKETNGTNQGQLGPGASRKPVRTILPLDNSKQKGILSLQS
ncbi:hypothetical protein B0H16DRAFT_1797582 [Mycena metata]|uniref:Uncharacterized protein n=1 Tax=Mycena metata TaxID=1033252 RepID=A0AAD7HDM7_9AGAR|nr:hypothetical protein B0H16DRAFT_1797582 [Mycena metata]